jgi:hypothetical protein
VALRAGERAGRASVATDTEGRVVISWSANVNHLPGSGWNVFARAFDADGSVLRNEFRVDLADRATTGGPAALRGREPKSFAFAWRDERSGRFEVYTRAVRAAD